MRNRSILQKSTPEQDLRCWDWLRTFTAEAILELWQHDDGSRRCKVCDQFVQRGAGDRHAAAHNRERQQLREKARKEALKIAHKARALKAEANQKGRPV